MSKETNNFIGCTFLNEGDKVKLSPKVADWKSGNTTTPQYIVDGISKEKEYTIDSVTPVLKVVGADQQFVSVYGALGMYPCWCFEKLQELWNQKLQ